MTKRDDASSATAAHGWPQPKCNGGLPMDDPKRGFANTVRRNAARRAMPFKATGHKGGISFR